MDPGKIFQIITNSTLLATRLLPANHTPLVEFSSSRYCAAVPEDRPPGGTVTSVIATHRHGAEVRYSITGGNKDGLFTIDQHSGTITLAAILDYEVIDEHELVVTAEGGMDAVHTYVFIRVDDVNDNPPVFLQPEPRITLVEEDDRDLPAPVAKVTAVDADLKDGGRLVYRLTGPGTQEEVGEGEAFFAIHARTGDLIQLRALDRDPPHGRGLWRLRVEVRDGQWWEDEEVIGPNLIDLSSPTHHHRQASWGHREPAGDPHTGVPSGNVRGGVRIVTPLTETYRNWRSERHALVSEPTAPRIEDSGSLLMDKSVPWSTAGATRHLRPANRVSDKAWLQESHSSASGLAYDSGGEILSPTTRDKDLNSKHDLPPAPAGWRDRRGTLPHDSQMRHVVAVPRKPRHAPYSMSREASHVVLRPRQEIRGDALHEKQRRQKRDNEEIKVPTLGGNISRSLRKQYVDLLSNRHEPSDAITHHRALAGDDGGGVKYTAALERNISNTSRYIPSDTLTDSRREGEETKHSLLTLTRNTQGVVTPNIKTTNPTEPQPENRGTQSASLGRKELKTEKSRRQKLTKEKENARFIRKKKPSMSSSTRPRIVSPSEHLKGVRLQRDASEMDFTFGNLEEDIEEEEEEEEEEESLCEEMMLDSGGGDSGWRIHVVETVVTVVVKDINDNAPVFPDTTMLGHVQENGAAGSAVVVVSAWDADDATDGSNARLTYAIEKNVVDEASGAAIFSVEPDTGLVRTARCCLDREATPEYRLQVVAADGGGLKGTGTVVVRVMDENDNPPRLARRHWELEVDETPPGAPSPNATLLELTAADKDARNVFLYRVVPGSGPGWENFGMRSVGIIGAAIRPQEPRL
ncbi:hypothetical protein O3P69_001423 [Scylla paramamosain]|uniref:Cadherin domain-containing protein n=1 Tax=Scylla paramamosain TaxID=85552 RepID=A0AAW0UXE5_SCYPA